MNDCHDKKARGISWLEIAPVCILPLAFFDFHGNYFDAYPVFVSQTMAGSACAGGASEMWIEPSS